MADAALVVSGAKNALGVAKKREFSGAAVSHGSCREFVLRGSADLIGAGDDHAKKVAIAFSRDQISIQQASCICGNLGGAGDGRGTARVS